MTDTSSFANADRPGSDRFTTNGSPSETIGPSICSFRRFFFSVASAFSALVCAWTGVSTGPPPLKNVVYAKNPPPASISPSTTGRSFFIMFVSLSRRISADHGVILGTTVPTSTAAPAGSDPSGPWASRSAVLR